MSKSKVRKLAKRLSKAIRADLKERQRACGVASPVQPPPGIILAAALGALTAVMQKDLQAAQAAARDAHNSPPYAAPAIVLHERVGGAIDITAPSDGVASIVERTFHAPFAHAMRTLPDDAARSIGAAGFLHGFFRGIVAVVYPAAAARMSAAHLKEKFHTVLGDAIAAHETSFAADASAARGGPGGPAGA